ncbi:MAG: acetoacetate decarboxylase family protein [Acidobacteriota bacterium]|nr:acetoacetate decarboxylase family protein [Acidobacteriota bacterium]
MAIDELQIGAIAGRRQDWITGQHGVRYPPEPWRLGGSLLISLFALPRSRLPGGLLDGAAPGFAPLRVAGRALLATAFAHYGSNGVLEYSELLVSVAGRRPPIVHIPQIWVDSEPSLAGGRELWGIPKELGTFQRTQQAERLSVSMDADGRSVAGIEATVGRRLAPGLRRLPLRTAQRIPTGSELGAQGGGVLSTNLLLASVRRLSASWCFAADGPLGYLDGYRPAFSVALTDATIVFGLNVTRP